MSPSQEKIQQAYKRAMAVRPKVGAFPYLAECLRQAGVLRYTYNLPSCQCVYVADTGCVVSPGEFLVKEMGDVPAFNQTAFIAVLRRSQNGEGTFPDFLKGSWDAGVVSYEADLLTRKVSYFGALGESYVEDFPLVELPDQK